MTNPPVCRGTQMQRGLSSISQQGLLGRSKYGKDTSLPGSRSCELPENTE